jgi:predicted dehydrogenase
MAKIRMAQYGTKHGHASGKLQAMQVNDDVEIAGVFEPDPQQRASLEGSGGAAFEGVHWFDDKSEMLDDESIVAIASEGLNAESLDQTEEIVAAGKHVWYDKPAGDNWTQWQRVVAAAEDKGLLIQMGYMLRYHSAFKQVASWARSGFLGDVFAVRAHMSTHVPEDSRALIAKVHRGGIFFDLGGHMLDQVVWILGRPVKVTAFLRNDAGSAPAFQDNTLGVFEFENALAFIDIAAMETPPTARRFEVYGSRGSAIIVEPFEPGLQIRLSLTEAKDGYREGEQFVDVDGESRQRSYELELGAFLATIAGRQPRDRPTSHELLVQETLLRATGVISD